MYFIDQKITTSKSRLVLKVRKTQEGGWIVLAFLRFLLSWKTLIKSNSRTVSEVMFRTKLQRIKTEREGRKTQSNYTDSFHKPEVVMSPLHFQGEFTIM